MVRPAYRSRSRARQKRVIPGNQTTVHYVKRRPSSAHCPITGMALFGVPRLRPSQLRKLLRVPVDPIGHLGAPFRISRYKKQFEATILDQLEHEESEDEEED